MIRGIFLSSLFLVGAFLFLITAKEIISAPSMEDIRRDRAEIATWPAVQGTLDQAVIRSEHYGRGITWHYLEVSYRFEVDGKEYSGNRLGIEEFREASLDVVERKAFSLFSRVNISDQTKVDKRTIYFLSNQPVTVHYDPQNPQHSLLDNFDYHPPTEWDWLNRFSLLFASLPLLILPLIIWRINRSPVTVSQVKKKMVTVCDEKSDWYNWLQRGDDLLAEQRFQEAVPAYERAREMNPSEAGTWQPGTIGEISLGECLVMLGRYDEATKTLQSVESSIANLWSIYPKEEIRFNRLKDQLVSKGIWK